MRRSTSTIALYIYNCFCNSTELFFLQCGQPKKFEDEELEALLDEDCRQRQEELAESLGVTQAAISKCLKADGSTRVEI